MREFPTDYIPPIPTLDSLRNFGWDFLLVSLKMSFYAPVFSFFFSFFFSFLRQCLKVRRRMLINGVVEQYWHTSDHSAITNNSKMFQTNL